MTKKTTNLIDKKLASAWQLVSALRALSEKKPDGWLDKTHGLIGRAEMLFFEVEALVESLPEGEDRAFYTNTTIRRSQQLFDLEEKIAKDSVEKELGE